MEPSQTVPMHCCDLSAYIRRNPGLRHLQAGCVHSARVAAAGRKAIMHAQRLTFLGDGPTAAGRANVEHTVLI